MGKKLLIVDDEKGIVELLKSYFELCGYLVYPAYSGEDALRQASCQPDLVLLDINMPDMDGLAVCETLREHIACPILFLTARVETADKIRGFQAGADDYIVKLLSVNAGQVFDRERIYERVWGYDGDGSSDTVMEHIRKIRAKFAAASLHSYIETVWGVGYKWNG